MLSPLKMLNTINENVKDYLYLSPNKTVGYMNTQTRVNVSIQTRAI